MSMPGPGGGGDFLEHLLGDLLGLMGSSAAGGANQIELARTLAQSVATGGQPEGNVEPVARMELEQIARVAELHIAELTGFPVTPDGTPVEILAVGPGAWAWHTLEDWRFLLEAMSPEPDQGRRAPPLSSQQKPRASARARAGSRRPRAGHPIARRDRAPGRGGPGRQVHVDDGADARRDAARICGRALG